MIFSDRFPGLLAGQMVQVYRLRHFIVPRAFEMVPKPYPTRPEHCIVFYIRGYEMVDVPNSKLQQRSRAIISGQYTHLIKRYAATREFLMVQAVLRPGALHKLSGIPSAELQNGFVSLEDVFPAEGREINDRLQYFIDYNDIIRMVDEFFEKLMRKIKVAARPADAVFDLMLHKPGDYDIEKLAREACLSFRQFERKAYDYLGVPPKFFTRVSRFIQSYDMRQQHPDRDWLTIAVHCGYHDYQHLVRDYVHFAGMRPNALFQADARALETSLGLKKGG